ncbi:MAG TPA: hypothetical protein VG734_25835 [Lacunisphaera sp.]|jgi:hypothetical protein|nr:hypothetical protein [Lacunisphaera sp.]
MPLSPTPLSSATPSAVGAANAGSANAAARGDHVHALPDPVALSNKSITGVKTVLYTSEIDDGNSGTADTIDWSAGGAHKSTLTGNCTYTFTSPGGVTSLVLKVVQGSGPYTVTWPATVKWAAGVAPTLSIANGAVDIFSFYFDGTNYYGAQSVKGGA